MVRERVVAVLGLLSQIAAGVFWALLAVRYWAAGSVGWPRAEAWAFPALLDLLACALLGLVVSLLRRPRSLGELLLGALFLFTACATAALKFFPVTVPFLVGAADGAAALLGVLLVWSLAGPYVVRTRSSLGRWAFGGAFLVASALLGALGAGVGLAFGPAPPDLLDVVLGYLALAGLGLLLVETMLAFGWLKSLDDGPPEVRGIADRILDGRRWVLIARMALAGVATLGCAAAVFSERGAAAGLCAAFLAALVSEVLARLVLCEAAGGGV
jgi:hypothetical protein